MMKSPPLRATSHHTPSPPSSTISDSNSPRLAISTRKSTRRPRCRKRPNQMYDEAAALLTTAYPNIFSSNHKTLFNNLHFLPIPKSPLIDYHQPSSDESNFVFQPSIQTKSALEVNPFGILDEFDVESVLNEEIEQGIDSIMGKIEWRQENRESGELGEMMMMMMNSRHGSSMDVGFAGNFELGIGLRSSLRDNDDGNWWRFSTVELEEISPRFQTTASTITTATVAARSKKKKKMAIATVAAERKRRDPLLKLDYDGVLEVWSEQRASPLLKLDYEGVIEAWSGKELPFSGEIMGLELDWDIAGVNKSLLSLSRR